MRMLKIQLVLPPVTFAHVPAKRWSVKLFHSPAIVEILTQGLAYRGKVKGFLQFLNPKHAVKVLPLLAELRCFRVI